MKHSDNQCELAIDEENYTNGATETKPSEGLNKLFFIQFDLIANPFSARADSAEPILEQKVTNKQIHKLERQMTITRLTGLHSQMLGAKVCTLFSFVSHFISGRK